MFIQFIMNKTDELRLRWISELQQDRTIVPWIKAAEILCCKTVDLLVVTDDRIDENSYKYEDEVRGYNFGSLLDVMYSEGETVYSDDYVDIKVYNDTVSYYTGDEYNWIFRKAV